MAVPDPVATGNEVDPFARIADLLVCRIGGLQTCWAFAPNDDTTRFPAAHPYSVSRAVKKFENRRKIKQFV